MKVRHFTCMPRLYITWAETGYVLRTRRPKRGVHPLYTRGRMVPHPPSKCMASSAVGAWVPYICSLANRTSWLSLPYIQAYRTSYTLHICVPKSPHSTVQHA